MTEPIGDDIFPPDLVRKIEQQLRGGWQLDDQGRITGGTTYDGMTPAEVLAERDRYRRMVGE